ncbi:MAG: spore germination protein [Thermoanaerobacteraceae bacterium]|nr:spore germination protein [Thermoanaerobacteraceae bacterium]
MSFGKKFSRIITFQPPQGQPFELVEEAAGGRSPGAGEGKQAGNRTGDAGGMIPDSDEEQKGSPPESNSGNGRGRRARKKRPVRTTRRSTIGAGQRGSSDGRDLAGYARGDLPADGGGQGVAGAARSGGQSGGDLRKDSAKEQREAIPGSQGKTAGENGKQEGREEGTGPAPEMGDSKGRLKEGEQHKRPIPASRWHGCGGRGTGGQGKDARVSADLKANIECLKEIFHLPKNKDIILRDFSIGTTPPVDAVAIFVDGLTDRTLQNVSILEPLMLLSTLRPGKGDTPLDTVIKHLLPGNQIQTVEEMRDVVDGVLSGSTVVLVNYVPKAIIVETKGWEHRGVDRPSSEMVVRGPQEAFTETLRVNTALLRKSLHSPDLITEFFKVGRISRTDVAMMYIEGLTSPRLLREVRRRLEGIAVDHVGNSGILEQLIEDNTFALAPMTLATERPDRVVAGLMEGQVAIIADGSPFVLIVPATFFSIFHTAEDTYIRWPYGTMLRLIRLAGFFLATFLPGIYIAIIAYHHEMIPTDLLMAISGSREMVPFPSVVEVLIMEGSFELIREAGIRVPGVIGPTLGIVGALILGQAAVAAHIVSPILIIVVAVTAIGSFAVPNYSLSFTVRLVRFFYIALGAFMGIYGLVLGFFVHLHLLAAMKSFGVPFLAPLAPITGSSQDLIIRGPVWKQEKRPEFLLPQARRRQPRHSRRWLNRPEGPVKGGMGYDQRRKG